VESVALDFEKGDFGGCAWCAYRKVFAKLRGDAGYGECFAGSFGCIT
jgi:hypothetical protein